MTTPTFTGGINIAMKIPKADYDATVAFYRDVLGLDVREETDTGAGTVTRTHAVRFGPTTLWLDRVDAYSKADLWLELRTDDLDAAVDRLARNGVTPCDEIERLAGDTPAHWVKDPAGTVHLLHRGPVATPTDHRPTDAHHEARHADR